MTSHSSARLTSKRGPSSTFPQKTRYFHRNKSAEPTDIHIHPEYLTNHRKSNLPEGESRKGTIRRIGNETHAALRQLDDADGISEALTEESSSGRAQEAGQLAGPEEIRGNRRL
jgi:hypothetical protein